MRSEEKLEKELRKAFPNADIYGYIDSVSIKRDTFYTGEREELIRLEKKYKAGLWCDARQGKVHYHFHSLGLWK